MLKKLLGRYKKEFALSIALQISVILCSSFSVVLFQRLLDGIGLLQRVPGQLQHCLWILTAYAALLFLEHILSYLDSWPQETLKHGLFFEGKLMLLRKMRTIDYNQYIDFGLGSTIQQVENGADAAREMLLDFWHYVCADLLPTITISLLFIGYFDASVFVYIIAGYALVFLITKLLMKKLLFIKDDILNNEQLLNNRLVRGIMEVFLFRVEKLYPKEIKACEDTAGQIVSARARLKMIHELFFVSFVILVLIVKVAILVSSIFQMTGGNPAYSVGTIVALLTFVDKLYNPIAIFNVRLIDYKLHRAALQRAQDILDCRDTENLDSGAPFRYKDGTIHAKDLHYTAGNTPILKDFSVSIAGHSSVGVVGASGSGKSTLLKAILGINQDYSGSIAIDGQEIRETCLNDLYGWVSMVTQEAPVFAGTLRENLALGAGKQVSDDQIYRALDAVDLKQLVESFEHGLDQPIGEKGIKLSGGERQRLALARVLLAGRAIILLDEATSNIDSILEKKIFDRLLSDKNATFVSVMHKLSNIQNFDNILVVDQGRIAAQGSFDELMVQSPLFRRLWRTHQNQTVPQA